MLILECTETGTFLTSAEVQGYLLLRKKLKVTLGQDRPYLKKGWIDRQRGQTEGWMGGTDGQMERTHGWTDRQTDKHW